ncbi:hypothetical protein DPMN_099683 [Dreissena polymorpha]|uniref:Uncharacterized protein n=1 Tax=Dreissena polymorpha TaxID=45954 RepID=A0A9D4R6S0_DREPO|nr:hypothetical protein DPMN_099683 [Dreissena polymorpha]
MAANESLDLRQPMCSLTELPHNTITAAGADKNMNGPSVVVPVDTFTDDMVKCDQINQNLNVIVCDGHSNTNSEQFFNTHEKHKKDVEDDVRKCLMQQKQRGTFNDPTDWRILERYLLAEATLKAFVKIHYGYGPVMVEDLNLLQHQIDQVSVSCSNVYFQL